MTHSIALPAWQQELASKPGKWLLVLPVETLLRPPLECDCPYQPGDLLEWDGGSGNIVSVTIKRAGALTVEDIELAGDDSPILCDDSMVTPDLYVWCIEVETRA